MSNDVKFFEALCLINAAFKITMQLLQRLIRTDNVRLMNFYLSIH